MPSSGGRLGSLLGRGGFLIVCSLSRIGSVGLGGFGSLPRRRRTGFLLGGDGGDFFVARQRRNFVDRGVVDQAGGGFLDRGLGLRIEQTGRIGRFVVAGELDRVGDGHPARPCGPGPSP